MEGHLVFEQSQALQQEHEATYIHIATFLPVRKWRYVISFLWMARRVQAQVRGSHGTIDYEVKARFGRKQFWTYSVWSDRKSVNAFVRTEPHATAVKRFDDWAGEGAAFVEWTSSENGVNWDEAMLRLQNPSFYHRGTGKLQQFRLSGSGIDASCLDPNAMDSGRIVLLSPFLESR